MGYNKPKHDFTKTMRNMNYSGNRSGNYLNSKPTEFYNIEVSLTPSDKGRLERFFKEETKYYNHLVEGFSSRVRCFPEHILEFDTPWQNLFGYVAETGQSLKKFTTLTESELPKSISGYALQLFKQLDERKLLITDLAAAPAILLPIVRKNMALEILNFYREQAARIMTPALASEEGTYKIAPEMLEVVDSSRKRHLQIPKSGLVVTWNAEKEASEIRVGYAASPITVPKINLIEDHNWNFLMIHQEPGKSVTPSTPWFIDIKKIDNKYLLKYLDVRNPFRSASFDLNKRRG